MALAALGALLPGRLSGAADLPANAGDGRSLMLDVVINGRDTGLLGSFRQRGAALLATRRELQAVGLKPPERHAARGEDALEALGDLPGITYQLDDRRQVLRVTAINAALEPRELGLAAAAALPPVQSGTGAVLNYSVVGTTTNGQSLVEGQLDGRIFTPFGVLTTGALVQSLGTQSGQGAFDRLDSTYTYSDADSLRRIHAGDLISGGLSWTRPVRLGGVQVNTDFSLRSDLVTFPVPTIAGQVAVPSSVDVLVNGVQRLTSDVQPGPFEIRQLPVVTGAGTVSVAVTNALGQQTVQTLPFYASNALLAPGLSNFSFEAGAVRLNYGVLSDDYRGAAGAATYRRGMTGWLTLEGHMEASTDVVMAGGGFSVAVGHLGTVSLAGAMSTSHGRSGGQVTAAFERISQGISLTGSIQLASQGFSDLAATYGDPVPNLQGHAGISFSLGRLGSLGVSYTAVQRDRVTDVSPAQSAASSYATGTGTYFGFAGQPVALVPAQRVSLISASYSRPLFDNRAYLYVTGFADLAQSGGNGVLAGITLPLGPRSSVNAGANFGSQFSATVQATQAAPEVGDVGWQVAADAGQPSRQLAIGEYKAPFAVVDAGIDRTGRQAAYRATAEGALVFADSRLYATNTIYDSFAVVDTDGAAGVHVLQENRPVGVTDSAGTRLVPDLRSYEANRLAIDLADVPMDSTVTEPSRMVRPADRSGVVVHIPVRLSHGALLVLVDAAGKPIPVGSHAVLGGGGAPMTVGYDGEAFATGLQAHNTLRVTRPDGTECSVRFDFTARKGDLPKLGPFRCDSPAR